MPVDFIIELKIARQAKVVAEKAAEKGKRRMSRLLDAYKTCSPGIKTDVFVFLGDSLS